MRSARLAEEAGDLNQARVLLGQAEEEYPREILPLQELLRLHQDHDLDLERRTELIEALQARLVNTEYPLAPGSVRFLFERMSDNEEILRSLLIGIERRFGEGDNREYLEVMAAIQGTLGMSAEARTTLSRLIAVKPTYATVSHALRIDLEHENWQQALNLIESVADDEQFELVYLPLRLQLLIKTGRVEQALSELLTLTEEEATLVDRTSAITSLLKQVAWDLFDADETERSRQVWQTLLKRDPDDLETQRVLANLFSTEEERAALSAGVDQALAKQQEPGVLLNAGIEYLTAGDNERAYDLLSRAIGAFQSNEAAWFNLGLAARRLEMWPEAIDAFKRALGIKNSRAMTHSHLATALAALERYAEAVEHLETALALEPDRSTDYYYLSVYYRALGNATKAAEVRAEYERRRQQD